MCLAQRNHIISIKSINAIEGSRSNVRGGRNENELTIVSTPGDSNLVDDIDDSILGSSSTDESRSHTEIDSDNSISGDATDDGAPLTVEHHHRSHHQGHGQSQHHNNHSKSSSHENNGNSSFDFYVYSMSYQPEFCRENNEKFDGCRAFNESWDICNTRVSPLLTIVQQCRVAILTRLTVGLWRHPKNTFHIVVSDEHQEVHVAGHFCICRCTVNMKRFALRLRSLLVVGRRHSEQGLQTCQCSISHIIIR